MQFFRRTDVNLCILGRKYCFAAILPFLVYSANDVSLSFLGTRPSFRHGTLQFLTVSLCEDFHGGILTGWAKCLGLSYRAS